MTFKHQYNCMGVVTLPATAEWLFDHPEAVGCAYMDGEFNTGLVLIGGIDKLIDGSKIILDYGSTGSRMDGN